MDRHIQRWLENVLERVKQAIHYKQYEEALFHIQVAFQSMPSALPQVTGLLLMHSAECHWHLKNISQCLNELVQTLQLVSLPNPERQDAFNKWILRAEELLHHSQYAQSYVEVCDEFLARSKPEKAQCYLLSGIIRAEIDSQDRDLIVHSYSLDKNVLERYLSRWKSFGIKAMQRKDYNESKKILQRALLLTIDVVRHNEARRSILSHLATVHFHLKENESALSAGKQLRSESSPSVDEAKRWKERGKKLFLDKNFKLVIHFYSLAIEFTPKGPAHDELRSTLLANRSAAYCKLQIFDKAFTDAIQSVELNSTWSKGHYRLGKSLVGLGRYQESCGAFAKSLHFAEDSSKLEVLIEIVNTAIQNPSGLEGVPLSVPKDLVQELVNRYTQKKDWEKLHLLFMGGGGSSSYRFGYGGLATGCDASRVPLEVIVSLDIKSVNIPKFVEALIKDGAPFEGSPGSKESPLEIATRRKDKQLVDVLLKYDKSRAAYWLDKGIEAFQCQEYRKAISMLNSAVIGNLSSDQLIAAYNFLSESYYEVKEYGRCVEYGRKLYRENPMQSMELAKKWKNRGNNLLTLKHFNFMSECYTLALNYAPNDCIDMRAAIHSNRSMSFVHENRMEEAKDDAKHCISLKKTWFRGYSRLGACWAAENRHQEALHEYFRGLTKVQTESEKSSLLAEIISTSMKLPKDDIIFVPMEIPTKLMNSVIKQVVKDKDVLKLKHLFVEKRCHIPGSSELQCLGTFCDCVRSIPLEMVMESTVQNKEILIEELLSRGASPHGHNDKEPITIALSERKYKTMMLLMRYGANPQSILDKRREPFDHKAPHLGQWLNLGRRALSNKAYSKAEIFYSLALEYPEAATDSSAQGEALKALSEVFFEQNQYGECLKKGRECFKVSHFKSESEALKWQKHARILVHKRMYNIVPDFLTLAMNYAPPANAQLRYDLLCGRSEAYRRIQDYQQAIEDGKSATNIKPGDIQGYKCLIECYKQCGLDNKMFSTLISCLKIEGINTLEKHNFLVEALKIAATLPEGTTAFKTEVSSVSLQEVHDEAVRSDNWELVRLLYLGGGGPKQYEIRKGGLGTNRIRSEQVPIEDVVSANFSLKSNTLAALIDHGANVNGLRGNANPLVIAASKKDVESLKVLLDRGSNPCVLTDGLPLLHKEVKLAISTGDFAVIKTLLNSSHPDVENIQDSNGNTLYHHAMIGKINNYKCQMIKCLINAGVNPNLINKQRKKPTDCCNKFDDRKKIIRKFITEYSSKAAVKKKEAKTQNEMKMNKVTDIPICERENVIEKDDQSKAPDSGISVEHKPGDSCESMFEEEDLNLKESKKPISKLKVDLIKQKLEKDRNYMIYLIERLEIENTFSKTQEDKQDEDETDDFEDLSTGHVTEGSVTTNLEPDLDDCEGETAVTVPNEDLEPVDLVSAFENLTWEVDCTECVWKTMRSKKVSERTKKQIIQKIRMLAEGRWNSKLCKRLEGEPKDKKILLYESRITKGSRIIWEKTIAFSARCSNDPDLRLTVENKGLIYSDIIRVWDIVLDHKDLEHRIQNVVKSHVRGSHCIIKAALRGMKSQKQDCSRLSLPCYYQERNSSFDDQDNDMGEKEHFFPPASSEDNEYHILKFYSFNSALINTLLDSDQKGKIDFPFKVTELEHAIINLRIDKPRAIILLGRSGTGKTTCCLYRLWTEFQTYWERAITAGPHIPKYDSKETSSKHDNGDDNVGGCGRKDKDSGVSIASMQTNPTTSCSPTPSTSDMADCFTQSKESQKAGEVNDNLQGNYEHLHQMFITKNTVLCTEVEKNFKELKNACPHTKHLSKPEEVITNHIDDIEEESWPLFIGSRDWLLLLDASLPGTTFFQRTRDGSVSVNIEGWGQEDTHLHFIPDDNDFDDEDDEFDDKGQRGAAPEKLDQQKSNKEVTSRREVTYQVFINELWPKMKKKVNNDFHPTLVWTEIRSFIKGSAEALRTEAGYLSFDEYQELGRKRAPNFMGDRSTVYQLFEIYQNIIQNSRKMFDEADVVYNLHQRLAKNPNIEWSIHNVYVDETQDFTQAELHLLILCCRFPNRMFFTGDTAQSIMRGIAFRFEDLKTLFHTIKTSDLKTPNSEPIRVPHRPYQLTHNYRSHAGILRLASSIVNLLQDYFPESFDRLEKDCGLFEGPKPVLLQSCSLADLAMILRGNKRQASRIEFGAHQAVLVVSEKARDNMPEELKYGLVLTIYEAKGLEFDDVLIYNFFKDSHAKKEWRVVTSYIEQIRSRPSSDITGLVEIQEEDLKLRSRPLEFNHEKHKVLNSELKFLYTAITRARVNVWFFDEDEENRAPMFEYFQRLNLVRSVTLDDQSEGNSATSLKSMFAEGSTVSEWRDQGHFFYKKGLWDVAESCFKFGNDEMMERRCKAQKQAQEAAKNRAYPKRMKEMFRNAALQFLECGMPEEVEICLFNAREKVLLANLYKKMKKYQEASIYFRAEKCYEEASQCMEEINDYNQAIEIFCEAKLYEKAIHVLERFNSLHVSRTSEIQGVIPPKPNRTIERLCYKLAELYFIEDKRQDMEAVLQRLPPGDRISFFKKNNCIEEAARALVEDDKKEEAARFLQLHGRFKEAMKYSDEPKFLADCSLYEARSLINGKKPDDLLLLEEFLRDAIHYYKQCGDKSRKGEAMFLLALQHNDVSEIQESGKVFASSSNTCGEAEVIEEMLKGDVKPFYYRIIVRAIERLLNLIIGLHKPNTQLKADQQEMISTCEDFFGLFSIGDQSSRRFLTSTFERFQNLFRETNPRGSSTSLHGDVEVKVAYDLIAGHLIQKAIGLIHTTTQLFKSKLNVQSPPVVKDHFDILFNWLYLDGVTSRARKELKLLKSSVPLQTIERLASNGNEEYKSCKLLIEYFSKEAGSSNQQLLIDQVERIRTHKSVRGILVSFGGHLCKQLNERELLVDTFLDLHQVSRIIDYKELTSQFLQLKETAFRATISATAVNEKRRVTARNGMVPAAGTSFSMYFRFYEEGNAHLYIHGDVIQSLHETCRRFLGYAAKSYSLPFPSIENTVMVLELQLTIALIMYTRLNSQRQDYLCCLPESYLSRLKFSDTLNCTRKHHKRAIIAIDNHVKSLATPNMLGKCSKQTFNLLSYIIKMMFGKITENFNVFLDTFSSENTESLIASGVAARVLVLSLTMLVNCGKAISVDCQRIILHDVFSVAPPSSSEYLKKAFLKLNDATSFGNVVETLMVILSESTGENLYDYRWKNYGVGLERRVAQPENNQLRFVVDVQEIKANIPTVYNAESRPRIPLERDDFEPLQDDLEVESDYITSEQLQRERDEEKSIEAAIKIQRVFRKFSRRKKLKESEDKPEVVDRLSRFLVDNSACTICGERFSEISQRNSVVEDHIAGERHKKTAEEFHQYKEFYSETVEQLLEQAKSFDASQINRLDLDPDMQSLEDMVQKATNIMLDIERLRNWKDVKGLRQLFNKIEQKIHEIQKMTETEQEDIHYEDTAETFDDDDDLLTKPMPSTKPRRKGKGQNQKGKKRRK